MDASPSPLFTTRPLTSLANRHPLLFIERDHKLFTEVPGRRDSPGSPVRHL
jgi:hypothetical protein